MMFNRGIMVLKMSGGGNGLYSYTNAGILVPKLSQAIQCPFLRYAIIANNLNVVYNRLLICSMLYSGSKETNRKINDSA
jgi:hypothetical protein